MDLDELLDSAHHNHNELEHILYIYINCCKRSDEEKFNEDTSLNFHMELKLLDVQGFCFSPNTNPITLPGMKARTKVSIAKRIVKKLEVR